MELPTITELAKGTAYFVKYQDGSLWYEVTYGTNYQSKFTFPIPVDAPSLYEVVEDAYKALEIVNIDYGSATVRAVASELQTAVNDRRKQSAGAGEFLASDKAIRFLRWIRPHLEMLQKAQESEPNNG